MELFSKSADSLLNLIESDRGREVFAVWLKLIPTPPSERPRLPVVALRSDFFYFAVELRKSSPYGCWRVENGAQL